MFSFQWRKWGEFDKRVLTHQSLADSLFWLLSCVLCLVTIFLQLTNFFIPSTVYMRLAEREGGQDNRPDNESSGCDAPWNTPHGPRHSTPATRPGENRTPIFPNKHKTERYNIDHTYYSSIIFRIRKSEHETSPTNPQLPFISRLSTILWRLVRVSRSFTKFVNVRKKWWVISIVIKLNFLSIFCIIMFLDIVWYPSYLLPPAGHFQRITAVARALWFSSIWPRYF